MLCDPAVNVEVEKVALPDAIVPVPSCVAPSKKVTAPVGAELPQIGRASCRERVCMLV